jgi:hypothetical protein
MNTFKIRPLSGDVSNRLRDAPTLLIYVADADPGYPCRQCLRDATIGEELILVSHNPFEQDTPYRAASPVFLHRISCATNLDASEVPEQLQRRQLSVRAFDHDALMIDARVIQGAELGSLLNEFFIEDETSFVDIHNASRGCWAARAHRVISQPDEGLDTFANG